MSGLLAPEQGTVVLDGAPLHSLDSRTRARAIGYLPQYGEIAWDLSVRNLVALGRLPHGGGEAPVEAGDGSTGARPPEGASSRSCPASSTP